MMFEAARYEFEILGDRAGTLVREEEGYVFQAADTWAWPLNGSHYACVRDAEQAILGVFAGAHPARPLPESED